MQTSYFAKINKIEHPIAICGWSPKFYSGPKYTKLAPKKEWFFKYKEAKESGKYTDEFLNNLYITRYNETVLSKLDPHETYKELCGIYGTDDVTLICYEKPEDFCHRHLVAEWLNQAGYNVKEMNCE